MTKEHTSVICTVDVVLLTLEEGELKVAVLKRDREPFKDAWALPGGYIHAEEDGTALEAGKRVLKEKTGIESPYLEQLATFSGASRDPRGWSISIAYYALVAASVIKAIGHPDVKLIAVDEKTLSLPFDHKEIVATAVERLRSKSQYSSLPCYLAEPLFTVPELQRIYEAVRGELVDKVHFRRKMEEMDMLEKAGNRKREGGAQRPAQLYRLKKKYRNKLTTLDRGI